MSSEDHTVSFSLEINVEKAYTNMRKLQTILYRALGLFRRLGLPENIDHAIVRMQRFIALLNQARLATIALSAASGQYGWAIAGIGLAATVVSTNDLMYDLSRGT